MEEGCALNRKKSEEWRASKPSGKPRGTRGIVGEPGDVDERVEGNKGNRRGARPRNADRPTESGEVNHDIAGG